MKAFNLKSFPAGQSEQFDESLFFYHIASQIEPNNTHAWNGVGCSQTFVCDNNSPIDALNGLDDYYTQTFLSDNLSKAI